MLIYLIYLIYSKVAHIGCAYISNVTNVFLLDSQAVLSTRLEICRWKVIYWYNYRKQ